jgi:serine/threonine-protein kinase
MPPPPPDPLQPGAVIAERYRLERPLGSGGMADVWEATDERLHRQVALKVLRADGAAGEEADVARRRFQAEGRLAARQIHRSIVTVFDAGEDEGRAYLVMERLGGATLADRLVSGPLSDAEARVLMGEVLAALEAAHRAGIVHRDIKPSNVLAAGADRWKVADFGIAKSVGDDATADRTLAGQVVGTPRFMAPERLAGQPATVASDVYSAGVLLREALSGRSDADPALLRAAERAASPDPAERFPSAARMAQAIGAGRGVEATVPSPVAPVTSVASPLDETAAVAASTGGFVAVPTRVADAPRTRVLPADGPGRRSHRTGIAVIAAAAVLLAAGLAAAALRGGGRGEEPARKEVGATSTSVTVAQTTSVPATSTSSSTTASSTSTSSTSSSTSTSTTTEPAPPPGPKDGPGGKPKKDKGPGKK